MPIKKSPSKDAIEKHHEEPENPIVLEREPDAANEVQSGIEATRPHGIVEDVVPVVTETSEAEFRIVNY